MIICAAKGCMEPSETEAIGACARHALACAECGAKFCDVTGRGDRLTCSESCCRVRTARIHHEAHVARRERRGDVAIPQRIVPPEQRSRCVDAYRAGDVSVPDLARRNAVATRTIHRWVKAAGVPVRHEAMRRAT